MVLVVKVCTIICVPRQSKILGLLHEDILLYPASLYKKVDRKSVHKVVEVAENTFLCKIIHKKQNEYGKIPGSQGRPDL